MKTILGESKADEMGVQKLEGVLSVEEQEALAAFRYKKKYGQSSKASKAGLTPVQKPRNPIDPNTGMIMRRSSSCDAKTHLVKDCYDTHENVRAKHWF